MEHLMVHLVDIDIEVEVAKVTLLLNFLDF